MSAGLVLDAVSAVCLLVGSALALSAGVALVRFPDLLSRMHAGTKPQVLGLLVLLVGAALQVGEVSSAVTLALVAAFQAITVPVGTHLLARASYRAGVVDTGGLLRDELAPRLDRSPQEAAPCEPDAGHPH